MPGWLYPLGETPGFHTAVYWAWHPQSFIPASPQSLCSLGYHSVLLLLQGFSSSPFSHLSSPVYSVSEFITLPLLTPALFIEVLFSILWQPCFKFATPMYRSLIFFYLFRSHWKSELVMERRTEVSKVWLGGILWLWMAKIIQLLRVCVRLESGRGLKVFTVKSFQLLPSFISPYAGWFL